MAKQKNRKIDLTGWSIIAMFLGIAAGLVIGPAMSNFKFIGTVWLNLLKMPLVPLVFTIMVVSVGSQTDLRKLGRVVAGILIMYVFTTFAAGCFGMTLAHFTKPGAGIKLAGLETSDVTGSVAAITLENFILGFVSDNMYGTFSEQSVIQALVIAVLFGVAVLKMKNQEHKAVVLKWFNGIQDMLYAYLDMVTKLTPIGVFCLLADVFATNGVEVLFAVGKLVGVYYIAIILQVVVVYGILISGLLSRISPISFLKKSMPVTAFCIATCSSTANIPTGIKTAKENFKVPSAIADFCIPLGAQVNFDGGCIMFCMVCAFIAQAYGLELDFATMLRMVLFATILSSSGGAIPSGGVVRLMIMAQTFNLPLEAVGMIAGFYRFLDMGSTTCNCLGDLACTVALSRMEERRARRLGVEIDQTGLDMDPSQFG